MFSVDVEFYIGKNLSSTLKIFHCLLTRTPSGSRKDVEILLPLCIKHPSFLYLVSQSCLHRKQTVVVWLWFFLVWSSLCFNPCSSSEAACVNFIFFTKLENYLAISLSIFPVLLLLPFPVPQQFTAFPSFFCLIRKSHVWCSVVEPPSIFATSLTSL